MAEDKSFKVLIPMISKTPTSVMADNPQDAVSNVVGAFGKRVGEPAHVMARRLDRTASVTLGKGDPVIVNLRDACPPPPEGVEADIEAELAEALAEQARAAEGGPDEGGMGGP